MVKINNLNDFKYLILTTKKRQKKRLVKMDVLEIIGIIQTSHYYHQPYIYIFQCG